MAKIRKKVQAIADNLQKVKIKVGDPGAGGSRFPINMAGGGSGKTREGAILFEKNKSSSAFPQINSVSPLPKDQPGSSKPPGKNKKKKGSQSVPNKNQPVKEPIDKEEKGLTGYAGLARRVARGIVGEIRARPKFWFDD